MHLTWTILTLALLLASACAEPDEEEDGGTADSGGATSDGGGSTSDGGGPDGGGADGGGGEDVDCLTLSIEECRGAKDCSLQQGYPLVAHGDGYCYDRSAGKVDLGCTDRDCQTDVQVLTSTSAPDECQWWVSDQCTPAGYQGCEDVDDLKVGSCP